MISDKYICCNCIEEEFIQSQIHIYGTKKKCSYCGRVRKVLDFNEVIDIITEGIEFLYDDPANGLGFVDGEYVTGNMSLYHTYDLVMDKLGMGGSRCFQDIVDYLPNQLWCKKEFYGFDSAEEKIYTWEHFVDQIKHKTRYFFVKEKVNKRATTPYKRPYYILDEFVNSVKKYNLINTLNKGDIIFRARKNSKGKKYETPEELGTPKPEYCIRPNRMSPAGIPMFYGSKTEETCIAELGNNKGIYTVGKWRVKKNLKVLNLTKLFKFSIDTNQYYYPDFPSIFDNSRRHDYFDYQFILRFASDLSSKIEKEETGNIDYVPTQVVAEYLRRVAIFNKKNLDGICFYSSIDGGINYTLFVEHEECIKHKIKGLYKQKIELISFKEIKVK